MKTIKLSKKEIDFIKIVISIFMIDYADDKSKNEIKMSKDIIKKINV